MRFVLQLRCFGILCDDLCVCISATVCSVSMFFLHPAREQSIAISLSVCVRKHLWNHWADLREIYCTDPLWPWLGLPLAALRYVMYFRFYR